MHKRQSVAVFGHFRQFRNPESRKIDSPIGGTTLRSADDLSVVDHLNPSPSIDETSADETSTDETSVDEWFSILFG